MGKHTVRSRICTVSLTRATLETGVLHLVANLQHQRCASLSCPQSSNPQTQSTTILRILVSSGDARPCTAFIANPSSDLAPRSAAPLSRFDQLDCLRFPCLHQVGMTRARGGRLAFRYRTSTPHHLRATPAFDPPVPLRRETSPKAILPRPRPLLVSLVHQPTGTNRTTPNIKMSMDSNHRLTPALYRLLFPQIFLGLDQMIVETLLVLDHHTSTRPLPQTIQGRTGSP